MAEDEQLIFFGLPLSLSLCGILEKCSVLVDVIREVLLQIVQSSSNKLLSGDKVYQLHSRVDKCIKNSVGVAVILWRIRIGIIVTLDSIGLDCMETNIGRNNSLLLLKWQS